MSKENLNLPKTSFSMKANLPQKEPQILEFWDKINLYEKQREKSKGKKNRNRMIYLMRDLNGLSLVVWAI